MLVETLLKAGVNVHQGNHFGSTALHFASMNGDTQVMKLLLDFGASTHIDKKDVFGHTALMYACENTSNLEAIDLLVISGCNLNEKNNDGETALTLADGIHRILTVERLILWTQKLWRECDDTD